MTILRNAMLCGGLMLAAPQLIACGDDDPDTGGELPDAGPTTDATEEEPDASEELTLEPVELALSATGDDALYGAAFADDGSLYAAGVVAETVEDADAAFLLVKLTPGGELDADFGEDGVVTLDLRPGAGTSETARGVVVQSDGKVVIAGQIDHETVAGDRDIALARFAPDGTLDTTFGTDGVFVLDLNDAIVDGEDVIGADSFWSLALFADDSLLVHGAQRATGVDDEGAPRTDTDWAAARVLADGSGLDEDWATAGVFTLDLAEANASSRAATIATDGSVIGSGYANTPGIGTIQPVVYKLTPEGTLDESFAIGGIFHDTVLAGMTEVYGVALVDGDLVTTGYGRDNAEEPLDWVSLRFDEDGALVPSWGENGALLIDVAGFSDNSRNILPLSGSRVLLLGGGRPSEDDIDAMVVMLDESGAPVESFGPDGRQMLDLGGPSDFFWNGAVDPDGSRAALVGLRGQGRGASTEAANNDAYVVFAPIE